MKKLLFTAILMIGTLSVHAVPAKPGVKKMVQLTDGTTIQLTLRGDEHYSYMTDADGNPYQMNADGRAERISKAMVAERWTARRQARLSAAQSSSNQSKAPRRGGEAGATTGDHRGLVILMNFADVKFTTENPKQFFNDFFNKKGFSAYGNAGSVRDYFIAQSYEQLIINFDVVGPYDAANPMEYYGAHYKTDSGEANDIRPGYFAAEAVDLASADVNYQDYDWNGDGEVDQVFIIYAGYAEAQGAAPETIWPHEWTIRAGTGSTKSYNGVTINTYGCAAELSGDGKSWGGVPDGIGTACHEFSHCLGLPDMYDTQGNNYGMSKWDVMNSGSYNDDSHTPAGYTSYERWFSKWMEPVEIKSMTRITDMQPLVNAKEAYILYNENNKNEYYLLENRQQIGFDKGLLGHGLLVLHVDYNESAWGSNSVNTVASHQRMTVIAADNKYVNSAGDIAGDTWPGPTGNTELTNYSTPAATLYNNNVDGTKLMSKPIDNITENTSNNTVSFVVCRPEMDVPAPGDGKATATRDGFTVSWPAVSGATSYELELTELPSKPTTPAEALQQEFDFSKCYSKTAGFTDISSSTASYGLSGWSGNKLFTSPNKLQIGTSSVTGYVKTPTWNVPESQDITIVMGANIKDKNVKGTMEIAYGNSGEGATRETVDFTVTGDQKILFHFTVRKEFFYLTIKPKSLMYLNYLAVYDGNWTAEQLGITATVASAPRRASVVTTYKTTATSYTFTGLSKSNKYFYRMRALGEENTHSQWSDEKSFSFTTGINSVQWQPTATSHYYDLQGRPVDETQKGIVIRKEGNTVHKVVNK